MNLLCLLFGHKWHEYTRKERIGNRLLTRRVCVRCWKTEAR